MHTWKPNDVTVFLSGSFETGLLLHLDLTKWTDWPPNIHLFLHASTRIKRTHTHRCRQIQTVTDRYRHRPTGRLTYTWACMYTYKHTIA